MIYFDNAATTYPKPSIVLKNANTGLIKYGFNSGRGGYKESIDTSQKIFETREKVGKYFNFEPQNIAFTLNCTEALNMAIKGSAKKGDHIIISNLEHNAVFRVVSKLYDEGIVDYDIANYSPDTEETINNFKKLIKPNTKIIVCMSASNVFGVLFPITEIGKLCKENGIRFIVDVSQSAGVIDFDAKEVFADIMCAPSHKGLYGTMGVGVLAVLENTKLDTIIEGGTGSNSFDSVQPDFMPDRFESGTLNNSGIIALGSGIDFIENVKTENIYSHELKLTDFLYENMKKNKNVVLYCEKPQRNISVPMISFNFGDNKSEKTASILADKGIATRAGYHCAPLAHIAFKTADRGTVRLCPSVFTTEKECEIFINTLKNM